jgi:prevent-host-death family protein
MSWQLQEAKARLSELIKKAQAEGPQEITVRGEPAAIVLSRADYDRLIRPMPSFLELMRSAPLVGVELEITREQTSLRDIDLS